MDEPRDKLGAGGCLGAVVLVILALAVFGGPIWGVRMLTQPTIGKVWIPDRPLLDSHVEFDCGTPYNPRVVPEHLGGALFAETLTIEDAVTECADEIGTSKVMGWGLIGVGLVAWGCVALGVWRWRRRRRELAALAALPPGELAELERVRRREEARARVLDALARSRIPTPYSDEMVDHLISMDRYVTDMDAFIRARVESGDLPPPVTP